MLSDKCCTYFYRFTKAEAWMNSARRIEFRETLFPVNIKANVPHTAVKFSIVEELFHSELIDLTSSFGIPTGTGDLSYH